MDHFDFKNKRALIRVDFNVPIKDGKVSDDSRIRAALPTIHHVLEAGGACILMSHLGRPDGVDSKFSLIQLVPVLEELIGAPVSFVNDCVGKDVLEAASNLAMGEVLLLENLRFHKEEKAGDESFARSLAELGDVYINDAFGTAHRAHASTAIIADFAKKSLPGQLLQREKENLDKVLESPSRPYAAIVGGAKVSSKISVLEHLLDKVDHLIIGGGMAYTFIKANNGKVGTSLVEEEYLEKARSIMERAKDLGVQIHLPIDSICAQEFNDDAPTSIFSSDDIPDGFMGLDIGPDAIKDYCTVLDECKTILWNGPMGVFEMKAFSKGTLAIAEKVAEVTAEKGAYSLVGGGDSVAAINQFGLQDKVSYISTGGGAMLEYLEGKVLPGIKAVFPGQALPL